MTSHPYVLLDLPTEVDEDIVPVVQWLNAMEGVRTLYSCQGDFVDLDATTAWDMHSLPRAMVMFVCDKEQSLFHIMTVVEEWNDYQDYPVEVEMDFMKKRRFRYIMRWYENGHLKRFIQWLKERPRDNQ